MKTNLLDAAASHLLGVRAAPCRTLYIPITVYSLMEQVYACLWSVCIKWAEQTLCIVAAHCCCACVCPDSTNSI